MVRDDDSINALLENVPSTNVYNLTFPEKKQRWNKWVRNLKSTKRFGLNADLQLANLHYEDHQRTGEYVVPSVFFKALESPRDPKEAAPLTSKPWIIGVKLSTVELAKHWSSLTPADQRNALPGPLKNTPLRPRSDAEGWRCSITPAGGGKRVPKKFPFDPHLAKQEWLEIFDRGKSVKRGDAIFTSELRDRFVDYRWSLVEKHGRSQARFNNYATMANHFDNFFGDCQVFDDITPQQWRKLVEDKYTYKVRKPGEKLQLRSQNDFINDLKEMASWAVKEGLVREPDYPKDLSLNPESDVENQQRLRDRSWARPELHAFLTHEREHYVRRAMILLALNCGLGNKDLAILTVTDTDFEGYPNKIDLENGYLHTTRPKTRKPRKMKLWPETIAALREIMHTPESIIAKHGWKPDEVVRLKEVADIMCCTATNLRTRAKRKGMNIVWGKMSGYDAGRLMLQHRRPEASDPKFEDLFFRTENGGVFVHLCDEEKRKERLERESKADSKVRGRTGNIRNFTNRAIEKIGLDSDLTFYGIRKTFNTRARQVVPRVDRVLFRFIMGHKIKKEEEAYIQEELIDDEVYERIASQIREWFIEERWAEDDSLPAHWLDEDDDDWDDDDGDDASAPAYVEPVQADCELAWL